MIIEQALLDELVDASTVSTLVGDRIYYDLAPQNITYPYITIHNISGVRDHTHQGPSGLVRAVIQFSIWSSKYVQGKTIAAAIAGVIDGWQATTMQSTYVGECSSIDESDNGYNHDTKSHHLSVDYRVWYNE
ncbi:MAG: DUF3168 domain-containing protein [Aestuariibacter sp.]|nr:DUF3168 domain-containing protein [Aestuariibacter sp.]